MPELSYRALDMLVGSQDHDNFNIRDLWSLARLVNSLRQGFVLQEENKTLMNPPPFYPSVSFSTSQ